MDGATGVGTASRDTGGLFAYAAAATTDSFKSEDAGVGITYAPANTLSYVRYEPDVYCSIVYRMFVDFWPQLIAGQVRLGTSLITGAWRRSPVLSGSDQNGALERGHGVRFVRTGCRVDGVSKYPPYAAAKFRQLRTGTTFLVEGGRSYVFGVVARAWVSHNVTSNTGRPIPQDATRFRLYAEMVCAVPYMAVT